MSTINRNGCRILPVMYSGVIREGLLLLCGKGVEKYGRWPIDDGPRDSRLTTFSYHQHDQQHNVARRGRAKTRILVACCLLPTASLVVVGCGPMWGRCGGRCGVDKNGSTRSNTKKASIILRTPWLSLRRISLVSHAVGAGCRQQAMPTASSVQAARHQGRTKPP